MKPSKRSGAVNVETADGTVTPVASGRREGRQIGTGAVHLWLQQALKGGRQEPDGRRRHVELGTGEGILYLYRAITVDQRRPVIVEPARAAMLETYYREIIGEAS
jgi:hypothetical protein